MFGELLAALYASQRAARPKMTPNRANRAKPVSRDRAVPAATTTLACSTEAPGRRWGPEGVAVTPDWSGSGPLTVSQGRTPAVPIGAV